MPVYLSLYLKTEGKNNEFGEDFKKKSFIFETQVYFLYRMCKSGYKWRQAWFQKVKIKGKEFRSASENFSRICMCISSKSI